MLKEPIMFLFKKKGTIMCLTMKKGTKMILTRDEIYGHLADEF